MALKNFFLTLSLRERTNVFMKHALKYFNVTPPPRTKFKRQFLPVRSNEKLNMKTRDFDEGERIYCGEGESARFNSLSKGLQKMNVIFMLHWGFILSLERHDFIFRDESPHRYRVLWLISETCTERSATFCPWRNWNRARSLLCMMFCTVIPSPWQKILSIFRWNLNKLPEFGFNL